MKKRDRRMMTDILFVPFPDGKTDCKNVKKYQSAGCRLFFFDRKSQKISKILKIIRKMWLKSGKNAINNQREY